MTEQTQLAYEWEQLSLPELQAKFAEVTGETTRCPNRIYAERADMRSRMASLA